MGVWGGVCACVGSCWSVGVGDVGGLGVLGDDMVRGFLASVEVGQHDGTTGMSTKGPHESKGCG